MASKGIVQAHKARVSFGKIKLGSVRPTRDFNYIEDIVAGFLSAL